MEPTMISYAKLPSSVEMLLAKARQVTGIDIVDKSAEIPLQMFCDSLNSEAQLTEQGAKEFEIFLTRLLCNRLRMFRDLSLHPEIREQQIQAPIFICGGLRTGSTKAHRMLSSSGDFNWLPMWQSFNPSLITGDRNESPAARIKDTDNYIQWINDASPNFKFGHEFRTHEPEEDTFILAHSLRTLIFSGMVEAPSYIGWLLQHRMSEQFECLKETLQYLQWQGHANSSKRWLLKCPFYAGLEPELLNVFPNAQLVMTHRHPLETIPSTCSLFESCRVPYSDASINASALVQGAAITMARHLEIRRTMPEIRFIDVAYTDVTNNVEQLVERLYQSLGVTLSMNSRRRIIEWEKTHPIHQKGVHKYSLVDFGLNAQEIVSAFSEYIAFLRSVGINEE